MERAVVSRPNSGIYSGGNGGSVGDLRLGAKFSIFRNNEHVHYYNHRWLKSLPVVRCVAVGHKDMVRESKDTTTEKTKDMKKIKKRSKMLKCLSRDLSVLRGMGGGGGSLGLELGSPSAHNHDGYGLVVEDQAKLNMISSEEASELLLEQLKHHLRAQEKELKKKKKQKAKSKAAACSSSSSSESSDSECEGEVFDASHLQCKSCTPAPASVIINNLQKPIMLEEKKATPSITPPRSTRNQKRLPQPVVVQRELDQEYYSSSCSSNLLLEEKKTIEVCMGGKCKRLGSVALLEEFQRVLGSMQVGGAVAATVIGCKCMGKCKDGPNVRVVASPSSNNDDDELYKAPAATAASVAARSPGSRMPPSYPDCSLEDVGSIVSELLGESHANSVVAADVVG